MFIFKRKLTWCFDGDPDNPGGGGGGVEITPEIAGQVLGNWREHIPEELATDTTLEGFEGKGFDEVVKGYSSLARKLGKNPIVRPDPEKGTDEDWNDFYTALGRPAEADGYEGIGRPEDAPEGWAYNETLEKDAKALFHSAGLTGEQAQKIWGGLMKMSTGNWTAAVDRHQAFLKDGHDELRKEWGGEYGARTKGALALAQEFGIDGYLKETGLDSNPKLLKVLGEVWNAHYREGDLGGSGGTLQLSAREAKTKIKAMRNDLDHPINKKDHPGHKDAVDELSRLYDIAYPEE